MVKYPASIDTTTSLPTVNDNITAIRADVINNLRDAIIAVEKELGVNPSGLYSTVRARLDTIETSIANLQTIIINNMFTGTVVLNVPIYLNIVNSDQNVYVNAGTFEFDMASIPPEGSLNRTIKLRVIASNIGPGMTVRLFNFNTMTEVPGSVITLNDSIPAVYSSSDISADLGGVGLYQIQFKMNGIANPGERAVLDSASLKVIWE